MLQNLFSKSGNLVQAMRIKDGNEGVMQTSQLATEVCRETVNSISTKGQVYPHPRNAALLSA